MVLGILLTILALMLALMGIMIAMFVHFHSRFEKIDERLKKMEVAILWIKFQLGHVPKEEEEEKIAEEN